MRYRDLLHFMYDKSGDDDVFFDSEPNGTNYQKRHNSQSQMKQPQLSVTMPSPLKPKIAKNNQMQDIEYFERLDIPDEKEDAVFK